MKKIILFLTFTTLHFANFTSNNQPSWEKHIPYPQLDRHGKTFKVVVTASILGLVYLVASPSVPALKNNLPTNATFNVTRCLQTAQLNYAKGRPDQVIEKEKDCLITACYDGSKKDFLPCLKMVDEKFKFAGDRT